MFYSKYLNEIRTFSGEVKNDHKIDYARFNTLTGITTRFFNEIEQVERTMNPDELKDLQDQFRSDSEALLGDSYLLTRARKWFRGYPGDFETLEAIYKGAPQSSEGIGLYMDTYFLKRHLARGVRDRKDFLRDYLVKELGGRDKGQNILNIACGSCRELYDMIETLNQQQASITCTDSDADALAYAEEILFRRDMQHLPKFVKHNAIKFISAEKTASQFGTQDIIYSAGLFDYLNDETLVRIFSSLYALLDENGVFIAPFKDKRFYNKADYHWLANWSAFYQRVPQDVVDLFAKAGLPVPQIIETNNPAIKTFVIRKK
ncbi:MAG TPA: class I SAM-dependent methyltransferase family protein [Chitinophagaceae bacterium]|nr:class I SAM-dependent methyltransferase family protein [Chitinophagaceae bacterium]